jgi:hypothetical protein
MIAAASDHAARRFLEFFAAHGSFASFNASSFDLVGDVTVGGLHLAGLEDELQTDLEPAMRNINSSVWLRKTFSLADPSLADSMFLKVNYEDGFAAFLNGVEIARRNAPVALEWDSASSSNRPLEDSQGMEPIDVSGFTNLLTTGANVLGIHALNDTVADGEFFIVPRLTGVAITNPNSPIRYFSTPTPGSANNAGFPGVAIQCSFHTATPHLLIRSIWRFRRTSQVRRSGTPWTIRIPATRQELFIPLQFLLPPAYRCAHEHSSRV